MAAAGLARGAKRAVKALDEVLDEVIPSVKRNPLDDVLDEVEEIQVGLPADPLDSVLDELMVPPLPEVKEVSAFSDEAAVFDELAQVPFSEKPSLSDLADPIESHSFLLDTLGIAPKQLSYLTDEEIVSFSVQLNTGTITPEDAMSAITDIAGGAEGGFKTLTPSIVENLGSTLSDWQIAALSDEDKVKAWNQIAGTASDDNISLTLAKSADNIQLPEGVDFGEDNPVIKTLFAVRGESISKGPEKVRERLARLKPRGTASFDFESVDDRAISKFLTKEYLEAAGDMNNLEISAINFYTSRGDQAVNWGLRNGEVKPGSALDKTIQFMNKTLDKLPAYEGVAYRNATADMFDRYTVGEVVEEKGFTSFTTEKLGIDIDTINTDPLYGGKPPHNTTFLVQSKRGRYIEVFSEFPGENEVLYKSGSRFQVVDKDPDTRQIFLEEVE